MGGSVSPSDTRFRGNLDERKLAKSYCMKTTVSTLMIVLLLTMSNAQNLAAQTDDREASELASTETNPALLLGPPTEDGPVVVRAAFQLQDITEIDDEAETFQFTGVLSLTWQDQRQAFDPEEAQVKEKIFQGSYQFNELSPAWYPQVVLANESGLFEKHGTLLRVRPDGTSTLIETVNATAEGCFNLRRYPFDTQRLEAVFEVLGFDSSEVVLKDANVPPVASDQDVRISQWRLLDISTSVREQSVSYAGERGVSSTFVMSMKVQRQSLFVLRLIVLPLTLIVMLSWSIFWMDRSSLGDRINVSFVGILTAVAYQIVVSDILPHISYVTLINGFLNFSLFVLCASAVMNLVVGECDKRGKADVGDRIDYRCRWIFPLAYFSLLLLAVIVAFLFF